MTETLYFNDAERVLPELSLVDAVVTVPPWNTNSVYANDNKSETDYLDWLARCFAAVQFNPNASLVWFWPGFRVAAGEAVRVLPSGFTIRHLGAWHKLNMDPTPYGGLTWEWEAIVWAERGKSQFYGKPGGSDCLEADMVDVKAAAPWHPCPAPLKILETVIGWVCPPGGLVLDPFCGSGTTLLAARNVGRNAIGIEQDLEFATNAAKRLEIPCQYSQQRMPVVVDNREPTIVNTGIKGPGSHLHDILPEGESLGIKPEHIKHYAVAIMKYVAAGRPKRTDEEVEKLLAICKACEHHTKNGKCRKCGCCANASKIAVKNKLVMKTETCPIGLWT